VATFRLGRSRARPTLLTSCGIPFKKNLLAQLARTAAGQPGGLYRDQIEAFSCVLEGVLRQLESRCDDPAKARAAWQALEKGRPFTFELRYDESSRSCRSKLHVDEGLLEPGITPDHDPASGSASGTESDSDTEIRQPDHLRELLFALREGEQVYLPAVQSGGSSGHELGISLSRQKERVARIGIVNSVGWSTCLGEDGSKSPQILSRSVAIEHAGVLLKMLAQGDLGTRNTDVPAAAWHDPGYGAALFSWMAIRGAPLERGSQMPPQKGGDCGMESFFAWLGGLLPPADYKLVKANTLNVLAQAAREEGESAELQQRLAERITSALSGHVVHPRQSLIRC
jgi:hypothetical protein